MDNNIALLLKVFFFKDLSADELLAIMAITRREHYLMGQRVFEAGDPGDSLYIIRSGSMMVKKGEMVLAVLGIGDTIGEMSFVDRGERSASVAAIEETELLKVSFQALETLLDEHPLMAVKVYRAMATVLSQRLREMDETIRTKYQPIKC
ncbi:MAG: cyclic nucleotide-binding domain-containing protein [Geobacteraceae bacterium]|nr:cyclic nucleotide-binding domain-containing protein [Geobacteraceae bacterium]